MGLLVCLKLYLPWQAKTQRAGAVRNRYIFVTWGCEMEMTRGWVAWSDMPPLASWLTFPALWHITAKSPSTSLETCFLTSTPT